MIDTNTMLQILGIFALVVGAIVYMMRSNCPSCPPPNGQNNSKQFEIPHKTAKTTQASGEAATDK